MLMTRDTNHTGGSSGTGDTSKITMVAIGPAVGKQPDGYACSASCFSTSTSDAGGQLAGHEGKGQQRGRAGRKSRWQIALTAQCHAALLSHGPWPALLFLPSSFS